MNQPHPIAQIRAIRTAAEAAIQSVVNEQLRHLDGQQIPVTDIRIVMTKCTAIGMERPVNVLARVEIEIDL